MVVFELSMPNCGSWNGKWSGSGRCYARVYRNSDVPKDVLDKTFCYTWDDGWTACVSVKKIDAKEAKQYRKNSAGFYGYDWMIKSIIKDGYIHPIK